jgi:hypothetical protein
MDRTNSHTWSLNGLPPLLLPELQKEVAAGGRFVFYNYVIFVVRPPVRFTGLYYVAPGKSRVSKGLLFTTLSVLSLGLLQLLPFIIALRVNFKGGVDVTHDVMANISEAALAAGQVTITKAADIYAMPDRSDMKAFRKIINDLQPGPGGAKRIAAGISLLGAPGQDEYHIGIDSPGFREMAEEFERLRKKHFYEHVLFNYIDLSSAAEEAGALLRQGTVIFPIPS